MITNNAFNLNCMPWDKNYIQDKLQEEEQKRKKRNFTSTILISVLLKMNFNQSRDNYLLLKRY